MAWHSLLTKHVRGNFHSFSSIINAGVFRGNVFIKIASSNNVKFKQLSNVTGEYEKLWSAVTGGRGTGRGRRRMKPKDKETIPTGFGKFGKIWPGLNTTVEITPQKKFKKRFKDGYLLKPHMSEVSAAKPTKRSSPTSILERETKTEEKMPAWKKAFLKGEKMYGQELSSRGWSGKTWRGREFRAPETVTGEPLQDFKSIVLELRRVSNMTSGGRKRSQRAIVVVGNGNGAAGFAVGKGQNGISALKKAKNKAAKYLYYVNRCEDRTIFHDFVSKHRKTIIRFEKKPPGFGLRCHRIIRAVSEVLGIADMRCKITGSTTPISVVRAVFQGLLSQETHQQLAERKGLHVVEFRPEKSMRPVIVASPSPHAAKEAAKNGTSEDRDYDFDEIFDPYKGAHRPRKVKI